MFHDSFVTFAQCEVTEATTPPVKNIGVQQAVEGF